jgi:hypothetical protein
MEEKMHMMHIKNEIKFGILRNKILIKRYIPYISKTGRNGEIYGTL